MLGCLATHSCWGAWFTPSSQSLAQSVLASFMSVSLIQARGIWEEGTSREKIPRPDLWSIFLVIVVGGRAQPTVGGAVPRRVVVGAVTG